MVIALLVILIVCGFVILAVILSAESKSLRNGCHKDLRLFTDDAGFNFVSMEDVVNKKWSLTAITDTRWQSNSLIWLDEMKNIRILEDGFKNDRLLVSNITLVSPFLRWNRFWMVKLIRETIKSKFLMCLEANNLSYSDITFKDDIRSLFLLPTPFTTLQTGLLLFMTLSCFKMILLGTQSQFGITIKRLSLLDSVLKINKWFLSPMGIFTTFQMLMI